MPKIPKTKADRKADKKALKKAMKKNINKIHKLMNEFWYNEGWLLIDDYRKITFLVRVLINRMEAVNTPEKWISDEDFAALTKSTEPEVSDEKAI